MPTGKEEEFGSTMSGYFLKSKNLASEFGKRGQAAFFITFPYLSLSRSIDSLFGKIFW